MVEYKIAKMPGDGIGPEIIREGVKVLDKASELNSFNLDWVEYDNGADKYLNSGELITEDTLKEIDDEKFVIKTLNRKKIWRMKTQQAMKYE